MNCEQYTELISAALDGELSYEEELELDAHLAACPQCRALMKELSVLDLSLEDCNEEVPEGFSQRVMDAVRTEAAEQKPARQPRARWKGFLATAAVLALVVAAGGSQLLQSSFDSGAAGAEPSSNMSTIDVFAGRTGGEAECSSAPQEAYLLNDSLAEPDSASRKDEVSENSDALWNTGPEPDCYGFSNEQLVRVTWGSTPEAPSARVLGSVQSLEEFAALFPEDDLSALTQAYGGDYFQTGRLLAVVVEAGSGSAHCQLAPQGLLRGQVTVEMGVPEPATDDMAAWLILAEVDSMFSDGETLEVLIQDQ